MKNIFGLISFLQSRGSPDIPWGLPTHWKIRLLFDVQRIYFLYGTIVLLLLSSLWTWFTNKNMFYRINKFYVFVLKFDEFDMDTLTMETVGPNIRHSNFNFNGKPYNCVTSPSNNRLYSAMLFECNASLCWVFIGEEDGWFLSYESTHTKLELCLSVIRSWKCEGRLWTVLASAVVKVAHPPPTTLTSPPGHRYCNRYRLTYYASSLLIVADSTIVLRITSLER